jgi:hypothetical protein
VTATARIDGAEIDPVGLHRLFGRPAGRVVLSITVLLAIAVATVITTGDGRVAGRPAALLGPVQLAVSVTVPLSGVLLVADLADRRARPNRRLVAGRLITAVAVALCCAGWASLVGVIALLITGPFDWDRVWPVIIGGFVVQAVAQLVGTGLGLLIGRPALAMVGTAVLPLALWLALTSVAPGSRAWLTPVGSATQLLSGTIPARTWGQVATVSLLWCLGLNGVAAERRIRRSPIVSDRVD